MNWLDKIKFYYDGGYWSIERVHKAVGKVITAEDYKTITDEDYIA